MEIVNKLDELVKKNTTLLAVAGTHFPNFERKLVVVHTTMDKIEAWSAELKKTMKQVELKLEEAQEERKEIAAKVREKSWQENHHPLRRI